jgi:hypothetical protein
VLVEKDFHFTSQLMVHCFPMGEEILPILWHPPKEVRPEAHMLYRNPIFSSRYSGLEAALLKKK